MADNAVELVRLRNHFYRDNYRRIMMALLLLLLAILVLAGVVFYMITHKPTPIYFATTADGRLIPIVPLNRPNQSDDTVLQWSSQAAVAAYSFNFTNYRSVLQSISDNFTPLGWRAYLANLEQSNNLKAIRAKKLSMYAVASGAPVIVEKGVISGQYSWKVQMPMLVTLVSASETIPQSLDILMTVTRVSTLDNPKGIQIAQFVAAPRTGNQQ